MQTMKKTRFFCFQREKFQVTKWHCALGPQSGFTCALSAHTRTVPGNPAGVGHPGVLHCGSRSNGPRQMTDKAIAQIPRPGNWVRLLVGSCGGNVPLVNDQVSVGPAASPPVPPTHPRSGSFYPGTVDVWVVAGCCPVHCRMFSGIPGPLPKTYL